MRAIGIILAGGNNNRMRELSDKRAIAAMPIAGSYRSIDFALSNMANSREDVAKAIDSEIHSIIEECHDNAKKIISEHMEVLHGCAKLLLEKEKVHRDEFEALFTMEKSGESNESI